jgi:hypothetical protein
VRSEQHIATNSRMAIKLMFNQFEGTIAAKKIPATESSYRDF